MSKIYEEYLRLKKEDNSKLYLFKSGKFYIFIGNDCDLINEYVVLKKTPFSKESYKCGFPNSSLEQYLKVFRNHKLKVEIIENREETDIIRELKNVDVNNITPIEALNLIESWKNKYE